MTGINGSAPKINLGLSTGVIALLVFGIIVGGLFIQETKKQSEENGAYVLKVDKKVNEFIKNWESRIKVSNQVNNASQQRDYQILQTQLSNEKNILGNLTAHRHVANYTRDITFKILNQSIEQEKQLIDLQNKTDTLTGSQYAKLADMRVKSIIGNISKEHEQIEQQHNQIIKYLGNLTNVR